MPEPGEKETREEWMGRCMADAEQRRSFPDEAQRAAVCESKWREHMKTKNQAPMPEEGEDEAEYMARCQDDGHTESECRIMWEKEGMMDRAKRLPVNVRNEVAEVLLYDVIGADPFFGGVTAKAFREQVKGIKTKALNLRINSPGGSVFEASAMMAALDEYKGRVTVDIDGIAASAASVVAMAGDEIRIAAGAMMMIHDPHAMVVGGAADMRAMADLLDKSKEQLLDAYKRHSKAARDKLAAWMAAETWFTGQEAVDAGLAHSVTDAMRVAARADPAILAKLGYKHVPAAVLRASDAEARRLEEETRKRRDIAARL